MVRGLFFAAPREVYWPSSADEALMVGGNLLNYFVYMVIIIVVAVPEGLPMSVTVSLALAMQKMTRANSLVRQLVACDQQIEEHQSHQMTEEQRDRADACDCDGAQWIALAPRDPAGGEQQGDADGGDKVHETEQQREIGRAHV